jgi:hypothetical protein
LGKIEPFAILGDVEHVVRDLTGGWPIWFW